MHHRVLLARSTQPASRAVDRRGDGGDRRRGRGRGQRSHAALAAATTTTTTTTRRRDDDGGARRARARARARARVRVQDVRQEVPDVPGAGRAPRQPQAPQALLLPLPLRQRTGATPDEAGRAAAQRRVRAEATRLPHLRARVRGRPGAGRAHASAPDCRSRLRM